MHSLSQRRQLDLVMSTWYQGHCYQPSQFGSGQTALVVGKVANCRFPRVKIMSQWKVKLKRQKNIIVQHLPLHLFYKHFKSYTKQHKDLLLLKNNSVQHASTDNIQVLQYLITRGIHISKDVILPEKFQVSESTKTKALLGMKKEGPTRLPEADFL